MGSTIRAMPDDIIRGPSSACKSIPGGGGGRDAIAFLCPCEFLRTRCTCEVGVDVAEEEGATLHTVSFLQLRKKKKACWGGAERSAISPDYFSMPLSGKMLCHFGGAQ